MNGNALCVAGPFPPPIHGMSSVNKSLVALAQRNGLTTNCYNTSPSSLDRSLRIRAGRIPLVVRAMLGIRRFSRERNGACVYLSVSSGFGIIYEWAMVRTARMSGGRVILHHHSFGYIDKPLARMRALVRAAGRSCWHIVLSESMSRKLRAQYPDVAHTLVLSNAGFIQRDENTSNRIGNELRTVGYLANLSKEKGMLDVLQLAKRAMAEGDSIRFVVAGPFEDIPSRVLFLEQSKELKNVSYIGPVYGTEKTLFFGNIDAFIFPTRYRNEAEPLVVLEALNRACPVIAYDRGCMRDLIDSSCGLIVARDVDFKHLAWPILKSWRSGTSMDRLRNGALTRFEELMTSSTRAQAQLIDLFKNAE